MGEAKVKLVPLGTKYYGFLYSLFLENPSCFQWLFPFRVPERDTFVDRAAQAVSNFSVILGGEDGRPIGIAYLYQWRPQDGVAYFHVSLLQTARGAEVDVEAVRIFLAGVFSTLNIRKLYTKVEAWQMPTVESALGGDVEQEGCLRDHSYLGGKWHDQLILSVSRDRWYGNEGHPEVLVPSRQKAEVSSVPSETLERTHDAPAAPVVPDPRWLPLGRDTRNLVSSRVRLVSVQPGHMEYLYGLAASGDVGGRWRFGAAVPTMREFQRSFHQGVFAQFVPVLRRSGQPFGHVLAYQADPLNGHVYIGGVTEARFHRTGYPMEAFAILLRYLFTNWNFRKVYMDLPEYNRSQVFSAGVIDGIQEEARLRDVTYYNGSWWDWSIVSISREFFMECLGQ
jgi:RimJ/RimL family protein N-acetyltransferase